MNQRFLFFGALAVWLFTVITAGITAGSEKPEIFVQLGHSGGVTALAVTPDGKYAVSGGADTFLKLWDIAAGREVRTFKGHAGRVLSLAISPNGRYAASACQDQAGDRDGNCILWDLETGRKIRSFATSTGSILSVAFTPDGRHLVTGLTSQGSIWSEGPPTGKSIRVWEISSGREVRALGEWNGATALAVTPDGRHVVANSWDGPGHSIKLWDISTGRQARVFEGHSRTINAVAVSADGRRLVSASDDHTVRVWDISTGRELRVFKKHDNYVKAAAISPDGDFVVSGGWDSMVRIWQATTGRELFKPKEERHWITAAAVIPGGEYVLSGDSYGTIKKWDMPTGNEVSAFKGHAIPVGTVSALPDGRHAVSAGFVKHTLSLWDMESGLKVRAFEGYSGSGRFIAESPDGRYLLLQNGDITLTVWDVATGRPVKTIYGGEGLFNAAAFHSGGRWVIGASKSQLKLFDVHAAPGGVLVGAVAEGSAAEKAGLLTGDIVTAIEGAPVVVWADLTGVVQQNPGKKLRFSVSRAGRSFDVAVTPAAVKVDDWEGKKQTVGRVGISLADMSVRVFTGHAGDVTCLAITPDGRYVVSGSEDKTLKIWEVATGREVRTLAGHAGEVKSVGVSPDGRYAVSAGSNSAEGEDPIRLWDLASGAQVRSWGASLSRFTWINAVTFSSDGRYVISGGSDNAVRVWNVADGTKAGAWEGHASWIHSLAATPDGRYLLSGSLDGTTRAWDMATGREKAQFIDFEDGEWLVITPEGYFNASANGERYLNVRVGNAVYGIENYREAFFRPDLVKVALAGGSLKAFKTIADVKEPPLVRIVDTPARVENGEVAVKVGLTDQGGGIGDIRLYLNGAAVVLDSRAIQLVGTGDNEAFKTYVIRLTSGTNRLTAVAFNADNSMRSNEAVHEVTAVFKPAAKPSLHALVVGINEFKNPKLTLNYPVADAMLFAETLNRTASGLFEQVNIKVLATREKTTREAIVGALGDYRALSPDDLFVFFVASHGTVDDGEYFLITSNVGSTRTERLREDAISQETMKAAISNIPATKKLIIIDTCNAGALGEAIQVAMLTRGMSEDAAIKILSRAVGSTILSASTSIQEALEGYQGHGLFTYVLVEGMKGKADRGKSGYIRTTELADYVDSEVPELAERVFSRAQYPTVSISGQSFPIGRVE